MSSKLVRHDRLPARSHGCVAIITGHDINQALTSLYIALRASNFHTPKYANDQSEQQDKSRPYDTLQVHVVSLRLVPLSYRPLSAGRAEKCGSILAHRSAVKCFFTARTML
jgi:hypothetical protein